jgi:hypothetical protein
MKPTKLKALAAFALAFTTVLLLLSADQSKPGATKAIASTAPIPPGTIIPHAQDFLGAITNGVKLPASTPYDTQLGLKQFYLKGFCEGYRFIVTNRSDRIYIICDHCTFGTSTPWQEAEGKGHADGQMAGHRDRVRPLKNTVHVKVTTAAEMIPR